MRVQAVIGACMGDEGKGLMVDYLCRQAWEKPLVIRFNGGAQAGHTVVTASGQRHVFHHYGAGTLAGADTFLSRFFLVNPILWYEEYQELLKLRLPELYVDPSAPVTTVWDMFINQKLEESRTKRHGSCGMGIHETMLRHNIMPLRASDLARPKLEGLLLDIQKYAVTRLRELKLNTPENVEYCQNPGVLKLFKNDCKRFARHAINLRPNGYGEIIFEGAQGLMLDQNHHFYPHVTHSNTGLANVMAICERAYYDELDTYYVARSYLLRHGAGPLPGEDPELSYFDNTNVCNEWQQALRFAPQDEYFLKYTINDDLYKNHRGHIRNTPHLVITHCDQYDGFNPSIMGLPTTYQAYGPTANDILEISCPSPKPPQTSMPASS